MSYGYEFRPQDGVFSVGPGKVWVPHRVVEAADLGLFDEGADHEASVAFVDFVANYMPNYMAALRARAEKAEAEVVALKALTNGAGKSVL